MLLVCNVSLVWRWLFDFVSELVVRISGFGDLCLLVVALVFEIVFWVGLLFCLSGLQCLGCRNLIVVLLDDFLFVRFDWFALLLCSSFMVEGYLWGGLLWFDLCLGFNVCCLVCDSCLVCFLYCLVFLFCDCCWLVLIMFDFVFNFVSGLTCCFLFVVCAFVIVCWSVCFILSCLWVICVDFVWCYFIVFDLFLILVGYLCLIILLWFYLVWLFSFCLGLRCPYLCCDFCAFVDGLMLFAYALLPWC